MSRLLNAFGSRTLTEIRVVAAAAPYALISLRVFIGIYISIMAQVASGQSSRCTYQNSDCQIADAYFLVSGGPWYEASRGIKFTTGDAACAASVRPPTYQNPKWVVGPGGLPGCEYDIYSGAVPNLQFQSRAFISGWAVGEQSCPVLSAGAEDYYNSYYNQHNWTGWYDPADKSVQAAGRLWCVYCRPGTSYVGEGVCATILDFTRDKPPEQSCKQPRIGNPIFPLTGSKRQTETIFPGSLSAVYDTREKVPNLSSVQNFSVAAAPSFGRLWHSTLHKRLVLQVHRPTGTVLAVQAFRGGAAWVSFRRNEATGAYAPDVDVTDTLSPTASGWRYVDTSARTVETYDSSGLLLSVFYASGARLDYVYSTSATPATVAPYAGLLLEVRDQNGRLTQFEYEAAASGGQARIKRVVDADGSAVAASYDASGNLSELNWPDDAKRNYVYENAGLPWALTGIVDENISRFSTYGYDSGGRATSTEYAGGVNRYTATYNGYLAWQVSTATNPTAMTIWRTHTWYVPSSVTIQRPNGSTSSLGAVSVAGTNRMASQSQPAGAGCAAATATATYDANGNFASQVDFNGNKSCHVHDLGRNLEIRRVEGLSTSGDCGAVTGESAALPAGARKTTTHWHPDWSLPVKQAEPKQITTSVYNGQPDPTAGNATASCAPASAVLPDGKPIAVLCKKVEQATTDATGGLGFNSVVAGTPRTWTYTYNQYGQVLTALDPLNKLTTYAYYSDTGDQHTMGDLQSVTDSAGRFTQYTRYDRSGRLMQSIDANGTVTDTTYTPRGWVKTVTVTAPGAAAQASLYDYDGVGQLKRATLPDGSALEYTYDAAHRLTSVKDTAGNSVTYTLDNMGNRTGEDLKDPSGILARNITRVYDALNRVQDARGSAK